MDSFEELPVPSENDIIVVKEKELPPWNGYGTFEDSEGNCRKVLPEAPKKDILKFLMKGR